MIHPTASVSATAVIGPGTRVWHNTQILPGARIGSECIVGSLVYVDRDVRVGNRVKIQTGAQLYRGACVGDGVFIGPGVCLANDRYPRAITPAGTLKGDDDWVQGKVTIGYGASLGAGSIVLPEVVVGRFAAVAAGSVVSRDVPDHGLVLGVPARLVGWVCRCGRRLLPDQRQTVEGARWRCVHCGDQYETADTGLCLVEPSCGEPPCR